MGSPFPEPGLSASRDPNAAKLSTAQAFKLVLTGGSLHRVILISIFWTCTIVTLFSIYAFGPQILALFNLQSGDEANIGYGLIWAAAEISDSGPS